MNEENKVRGLSEQQVKENRERWGENILTPPERTSMWKLYLEKYNDPIIKIPVSYTHLTLPTICSV